jgi:hypothetical protein
MCRELCLPSKQQVEAAVQAMQKASNLPRSYSFFEKLFWVAFFASYLNQQIKEV